MISREDVEKMEEQLARNRALLARGGHVGPVSIGEPPIRLKPPKVVEIREISGRRIELIATAVEVVELNLLETYAKKLRVEQLRPDCPMQSRIVSFRDPVRVDTTGIYIPEFIKKGKKQIRLDEHFDLWLPFSGDPNDRKRLKARGIVVLNK